MTRTDKPDFYHPNGDAYYYAGLAPCPVCGKVHTYHDVIVNNRDDGWDEIILGKEPGDKPIIKKIVEDGDCTVPQYTVLFDVVKKEDQ